MFNIFFLTITLVYIACTIFYTGFKYTKQWFHENFKFHERNSSTATGKTSIKCKLTLLFVQILELVWPKNIFFINSKVKLKIFAYCATGAIILFGSQVEIPWENLPFKFKIFAIGIPGLIVLYGIGRFLTIPSLLLYFMNVMIVLQYSIVFLQVNFSAQKTDPIMFVLSIAIPICYSFILLMNVIKLSNHILFTFLNIIGILSFVYSITGVIFGFHYFNYQSFYHMYSTETFDLFNNQAESIHLLYVIKIGLDPFFSLPNLEKFSPSNPLTYVPFGEFILGVFFNILFVSFLISYFVSTFSGKGDTEKEKQSDKPNF
jgi:hypothetical protein